MIVKLTELRAGNTGQIVAIEGGRGAKRNVENIGIRVGKTIKKISQQLGRGPVVIQSGKAEIALGFGMAQKVLVEVKKA